MSLPEFSLKRPVTAAMVTLSVLVVGYVAFGRLPIEQFPSISSSGISASVRYSSASPEEVERLITVPLEAALGTLNNVDRISSSSRNGNANVRVDFKAGTDMDLANMEMRERVDQLTLIACSFGVGRAISAPSCMPIWLGRARRTVYSRSYRRLSCLA